MYLFVKCNTYVLLQCFLTHSFQITNRVSQTLPTIPGSTCITWYVSNGNGILTNHLDTERWDRDITITARPEDEDDKTQPPQRTLGDENLVLYSCVHSCVCAFIWVCVCVCRSSYAYVCIHVCVSQSVIMCMGVNVCVRAWMCICVQYMIVYTWVYQCMWTYLLICFEVVCMIVCPLPLLCMTCQWLFVRTYWQGCYNSKTKHMSMQAVVKSQVSVEVFSLSRNRNT